MASSLLSFTCRCSHLNSSANSSLNRKRARASDINRELKRERERDGQVRVSTNSQFVAFRLIDAKESRSAVFAAAFNRMLSSSIIISFSRFSVDSDHVRFA
jgi:TolB-like protein